MPDNPEKSALESGPPWSIRLLTLAYYVGGAAISKPRGTDFQRHHHAQALAIFLLLLGIGALFIGAVVVVSYLMTEHRAWYEGWGVEAHVVNAFRKAFLCWLVFWAFGVGMALLGAMRDMPLVVRITRRPRLLAWSARGCVACCALLATALALGIHARSLVRSDTEPAKAYFLYHDDGTFPRLVFALGFYRMARAAQAHWGDGSTQLLPLTEATVGRAIGQGAFVFIGSHGVKSGLILDQGFLRPQDVAAMRHSEDLSLVYLAGCDSGAARAGWEEAFAPAEVVTFERLTSVLEHIWWLWFEGPRRIAGLHRD